MKRPKQGISQAELIELINSFFELSTKFKELHVQMLACIRQTPAEQIRLNLSQACKNALIIVASLKSCQQQILAGFLNERSTRQSKRNKQRFLTNLTNFATNKSENITFKFADSVDFDVVEPRSRQSLLAPENMEIEKSQSDFPRSLERMNNEPLHLKLQTPSSEPLANFDHLFPAASNAVFMEPNEGFKSPSLLSVPSLIFAVSNSACASPTSERTQARFDLASPRSQVTQLANAKTNAKISKNNRGAKRRGKALSSHKKLSEEVDEYVCWILQKKQNDKRQPLNYFFTKKIALKFSSDDSFKASKTWFKQFCSKYGYTADYGRSH